MWKLTSGRRGSLVTTLTSRVTRVPEIFSVAGSKETLTVVCSPGATFLSLTSDAVHPQVDFVSLISRGFTPSLRRTISLLTLSLGPMVPKS